MKERMGGKMGSFVVAIFDAYVDRTGTKEYLSISINISTDEMNSWRRLGYLTAFQFQTKEKNRCR